MTEDEIGRGLADARYVEPPRGACDAPVPIVTGRQGLRSRSETAGRF
jgi:hypothetical protein